VLNGSLLFLENLVKEGAKLLCGGEIPHDMDGFFYPPTVLADVSCNNIAFKEEIFGPGI
jgi:acyl-CoA reductase-like NAD-dependent aldehyde dehydrogenase